MRVNSSFGRAKTDTVFGNSELPNSCGSAVAVLRTVLFTALAANSEASWPLDDKLNSGVKLIKYTTDFTAVFIMVIRHGASAVGSS